MTLQETLQALTVNDLKQRQALLPTAGGATRKDSLIASIRDYLLSDALGETVARLSALESQVVAEIVHNWNGLFRVVAFEAKYGSLPDFFTRDPYARYSQTPEPPSALKVLIYQNQIPEDLAARLARLIPPPPPLRIDMLGDEQLPEVIARPEGEDPEPLRRADTEGMVQQELPALLHLIAQGGLAVSAKTGLPGTAAVSRIEVLLVNGDWYGADEDGDLARWAGGPIRPIRAFAWPLLLQVGGLARIDGSKLALTPKGRKALAGPLHEVVRDLFERWQRKGAPDELRRVDLIKGQTSKGVGLSPSADRRAVIADALRACCPDGQWLSVDDLFRLMKIEAHRFEVTAAPWKLYIADANYGNLADDGNTFEILEARYTLAYLFEYLATLGLIDVAYTLPYRARVDYTDCWGTDDLEFLSRYDGLRYLRLNALGAWCLGLAETYAPRPVERPPLLRFTNDLAFTLLRPAEPAEQVQLAQIATPVDAERWTLNSGAMLTQGADADARARIRGFIESAHADALPPAVRELLAGIDERAAALTDAGPARLIACRDAALAILLSADPATAATCSRVGERHLVVHDKQLAAFRKGLGKLGFVLPALVP